MYSKRYFSYVRVSTARQGQTGTSLTEQLAAIERYARKWNLEIVKQYEEQETAAKHGRPVFLEMLKALRLRNADGVIIHKIDRSTRNLKDWADLGTMIDSGIEVHFANESIDLTSRGGRLSADIQAVIAADYIRNLREEVKKGFYGRLKQGFYPMPAPIGYLDAGAGKPKIPDSLTAPLVKKAFELYSTGKWSIYALTQKMAELGLRNKNGNPLHKNGIHKMLKNKFYTGLIEIDKTGETFAGQHQPLIRQSLFDRVQDVFAGKKIDKKQTHFFVFRRLLDCRSCRYKTIAERQKGFVYYRCQTRECPQKTIREEQVEKEFVSILKRLRFSDEENSLLEDILSRQENEAEGFIETTKQTLSLQMEKCRRRLLNLTDAFVDESIERELFLEKKNGFLIEEQKIKEQLLKLENGNDEAFTKTRKILEQANKAYSSYKQAIGQEKREMVQIVTSNLWVNGKILLFKLNYPFELIVNRSLGADGGALRDVPRTDSSSLSGLLRNLLRFFSSNDIE
jgi:DNA invertase Pin-like site-specific DNA recombinase